MKLKSIHQFSFACSSGSGVTNGMLYTRKLLRLLGFQSEIYSVNISVDLIGNIYSLKELQDNTDSLLLVHHCMGYVDSECMLALTMPKVMVYHNITPPEFLPANSEIGAHAKLGRQQLAQWNKQFIGAIGDSVFNAKELYQHQYANVTTIPMLVDLEKLTEKNKLSSPDTELVDLTDAYNILFVGRICENKNQKELVDVIHHLKHMTTSPIRLILVGEVTSGEYQQAIEKRILECGLTKYVHLTGKVDEHLLAQYYQNADVFLCLSDHEGFGMPLIEAMHFKLPIIARDSSNIADTLGVGGLLLKSGTDSRQCASAVHTLMREPALKRQLISQQLVNLKRYSKETILEKLSQYLTQLDIQLPKQEANLSVKEEYDNTQWQIEGPFDSSYSLAIVNRELARALKSRQVDVSLRSREGHGDFQASTEFLNANPDCAKMSQQFESAQYFPYAALRFTYPPKVDDMVATCKVIHSYGWEETGFPKQYVDQFNRRLDLITVLSPMVGKVLRDNGVRIPIVVTGAGVDHLLKIEASDISQEQSAGWKTFRFLHISSCFPRKGVDVLLSAYGKAFRLSDDVSLIIKTFTNPHHTIQEDLKQLQKNDPTFPHVVIIEEDWSQEKMVGLYQACHAFVAPSRGEGLGLPMAEAMLFDLPVITSNWGGQTEFCNEETAWCCDYEFTKADTHLGLTHSLWSEPNDEHLSQLMKEVFSSSKEDISLKTKKAKEKIVSSLTWDKTAENIQLAMQALSNQKTLRNDPLIAWISTWNSRCGIATYSKYLTRTFPQNRITILANHVQARTEIDQENVLRCWNDSMDENLELIYENIIERNMTAVVIQYNFGFFSLEHFEKFLRKLKVKNIATYIFFHSTADVKSRDPIITLSSILPALAAVDKIFVHGVQDVNRLKKWGIVDNVVFFPHGVEQANTNKSSKLKEQFFSKTVIASYGFLLPHKGIQNLIKAFYILHSQNENHHLLLVNSLYPADISKLEEQHCRQLINELGLQNNVTFMTDFLSEEESFDILSCADIIVFPYQQTQESASGAVRVGLSTGKKVAVTPLAIFDDVKEAVHYLPGVEIDQIAQGISQILNTENINLEKQVLVDNWFEEREWSTLSTRLFNIIEGVGNPLEDYARNM
jgi:glycosyltransferase involved in cell wall biosynthesis